jgi:hypothetical protein
MAFDLNILDPLDLHQESYHTALKSLFLIKAIRAVPTAALAAIASFQVVGFGEDDVSFLAVVKILGIKFIIVKLHDWLLYENRWLITTGGFMILVIPFIFPSTFNALAIWPFIILRERDLRGDQVLLHHERIHLKQQMELLWIFFFLLYFAEFLAKVIIYREFKRAYRNISFEREAYHQERNPDYARNKPFWSFVRYIADDPHQQKY